MLTFGMPTLIETATPAQAAALCGELGLSFLELNTNFPQYQPRFLSSQELCRLRTEYHIDYTIHLNDEMPVADFNAYVAEGYLKSTIETIDFAKRIGAKKLNMHMSEGAHYTTPERIIYFYEAYLQEYLDGIRCFADACEKAIGDSDICICVENSNGYRPFQIQALKVLLERKAFGLTIDIGHNYCSGGNDASFILSHKDRLHHMHMHDAKDGKKDHLALGSGILDIPGYIDLARSCDCTVVLETKTARGLQESVRWVNQYIKR